MRDLDLDALPMGDHDAAMEIAQALSELSPPEQHRVMRRVLAHYQKKHDLQVDERDALSDKLRQYLKDHTRAQRAIRAVEHLQAWLDTTDWKLEKCRGSRLHKVYEAAAAHNIFRLGSDNKWIGFQKVPTQHTFVVNHDWAAVMPEDITDAEFRLPYDTCAFEFQVSGKRIVLLVSVVIERASCLLETPECWISAEQSVKWEPGIKMLWEQVKAICVALDAEVAEHEVVRAPEKLNRKRIKRGKEPRPDHYVVNLARRHRISNPRAGTGEGSKKRLHFRRGHWRHYEDHKTWIRWCLVGDPDLGFVSKDYSL